MFSTDVAFGVEGVETIGQRKTRKTRERPSSVCSSNSSNYNTSGTAFFGSSRPGTLRRKTSLSSTITASTNTTNTTNTTASTASTIRKSTWSIGKSSRKGGTASPAVSVFSSKHLRDPEQQPPWTLTANLSPPLPSGASMDSEPLSPWSDTTPVTDQPSRALGNRAWAIADKAEAEALAQSYEQVKQTILSIQALSDSNGIKIFSSDAAPSYTEHIQELPVHGHEVEPQPPPKSPFRMGKPEPQAWPLARTPPAPLKMPQAILQTVTVSVSEETIDDVRHLKDLVKVEVLPPAVPPKILHSNPGSPWMAPPSWGCPPRSESADRSSRATSPEESQAPDRAPFQKRVEEVVETITPELAPKVEAKPTVELTPESTPEATPESTPAPSEITAEEESPPSSPEPIGRMNPDAMHFQRFLRRMEGASPVVILNRLKEEWDTFDEAAMDDFSLEKHLSMLTALHMKATDRFAQHNSCTALTVPLPPLAPKRSRKILEIDGHLGEVYHIAGMYPQSKIYHLTKQRQPLDISLPAQAKQHPLPGHTQAGGPNASAFPFVPLSYEDGSIHYIRASRLAALLPAAQLPNVLAECHRVLVPGGVLEVRLMDAMPARRNTGPKLAAWLEENLLLNLEAGFLCTRPLALVPKWVKDAGFKSLALPSPAEAPEGTTDSAPDSTPPATTPTAAPIDRARAKLGFGRFLRLSGAGTEATPSSLALLDGQTDQDAVVEQVGVLIARALWKDTWGPFVEDDGSGARWWWEDEEIVAECKEWNTVWDVGTLTVAKDA